MSITLTGLHLYPIKSCAALSPPQAMVEARGLAGDRRWMIVDGQNRFVTGREHPRLVLIRAEPVLQGLLLRAPGMSELLVKWPQPSAKRASVVVWDSQVDAVLASSEAHRWLSQFMRHEVKLVHMDAQAWRRVNPKYSQPGDQVSFADAYPLLLISQASLDALNARLHRPVSMLRFRPNLVIAGVPEYAEDGWRRIRIGGVEFEFIKPCVRCGFVNVGPESGVVDPGGEPLRTLATYRRAEKGVTFGQNLIARGNGRLRIGDKVEVMS